MGSARTEMVMTTTDLLLLLALSLAGLGAFYALSVLVLFLRERRLLAAEAKASKIDEAVNRLNVPEREPDQPRPRRTESPFVIDLEVGLPREDAASGSAVRPSRETQLPLELSGEVATRTRHAQILLPLPGKGIRLTPRVRTTPRGDDEELVVTVVVEQLGWRLMGWRLMTHVLTLAAVSGVVSAVAFWKGDEIISILQTLVNVR